MAHFANKQYVKKMAECYGMTIQRSHKAQSLVITMRSGKELLHISDSQSPEKAWEHMWMVARLKMELFTGISIMDDWRDL
jgi:hypothetical protein